MRSRYVMQIVDRSTGDVVQFEPGLSVETAFIADCAARVAAKGVGMFRSQVKVEAAVLAGIQEAIHALKLKIHP